ncbi:MAG: polyprenyl synthetase family protein [Thermomicrobium sp.]|nr:polyprenyl synthetase family protein [Thermomicrobium sp.]
MTQELALVEERMRTLLEQQAAHFVHSDKSFPLYQALGYHLGWFDERLRPTGTSAGKRFRPLLCLRSCYAVSGSAEQAVAIAAAIELLHNFTLIHDDIQDRSETRRHRPTLWALWGDAQAINAGDALFALSQLAALNAAEREERPRGIEIVRRFNETTLRIVEGQVLDLSFEARDDVSTAEYLLMIERKTAALTAYAAWAGATVGGGAPETAERFADVGRVLGLGFQVQDDYLGVWGDPERTGKARGDDLRRRKKSLPVIALIERVSPAERGWIRHAWGERDELDTATVERLLERLDYYGIRDIVRATVARYHDEAQRLLAGMNLPSERLEPLRQLVEQLAAREA